MQLQSLDGERSPVPYSEVLGVRASAYEFGTGVKAQFSLTRWILDLLTHLSFLLPPCPPSCTPLTLCCPFVTLTRSRTSVGVVTFALVLSSPGPQCRFSRFRPWLALFSSWNQVHTGSFSFLLVPPSCTPLTLCCPLSPHTEPHQCGCGDLALVSSSPWSLSVQIF